MEVSEVPYFCHPLRVATKVNFETLEMILRYKYKLF
jgi:hypothetical protein